MLSAMSFFGGRCILPNLRITRLEKEELTNMSFAKKAPCKDYVLPPTFNYVPDRKAMLSIVTFIS